MIYGLVTLAKNLGKFLAVLALMTMVGQIPIKEKSLENHYHEFVNSQNFQEFYWAMMTPVTWTGEKVVSLVKEQKLPEVR